MAKKNNIKCDISANWAKATFIPKDGEIIVYSDLGKIKRGNGIAALNDLPFENSNEERYEGFFTINKEE